MCVSFTWSVVVAVDGFCCGAEFVVEVDEAGEDGGERFFPEEMMGSGIS